jgi:hypothetical protein
LVLDKDEKEYLKLIFGITKTGKIENGVGSSISSNKKLKFDKKKEVERLEVYIRDANTNLYMAGLTILNFRHLVLTIDYLRCPSEKIEDLKKMWTIARKVGHVSTSSMLGSYVFKSKEFICKDHKPTCTNTFLRLFDSSGHGSLGSNKVKLAREFKKKELDAAEVNLNYWLDKV